MVKRIKLPLEMANGVAVRTLEELKENWDLERIVSYYHNGRLLTWLSDRYYDEQAERIQALDKDSDANELQKQICGIFDIPFTEEETVDVKAVAARNEKLNKLRKLTSDDEILNNVDKVAFNQEELADLLDEDEPVIYLVDNTYTIPLSVKNKKYIGVGSVTAVINSKETVDFEKLGIVFKNVVFNKEYVEIADPKKFYLKGKEYYDKKNYEDALIWFKKAAEQGYAEAQSELGLMYNNNLGVNRDYQEALKWYQKAADQQNATGEKRLGWMYENGRGVTQDYAEAVRWYRKSAEQGNAAGQNSLGNMYRDGKGVAQDYIEALKWYRKSAEQGNADGEINLGWMYENGCGVTKDYAEALKWYHKAAEQGDATAQNNTGIMYQNGKGVARDYAEALKWYHKSAEQGNASAKDSIGLMYENGYGVSRDIEEAVKWYRKSAEQDNAWGQLHLGTMYRDGNGVVQNDAEAVKWYRKSAEQGNMYAQRNLGWMYQNGRGVTQDYAEAVKWYRKSAEKGYDVAIADMGYMYEEGKGVGIDPGKAREFYKRAADAGNSFAAGRLTAMENNRWDNTSRRYDDDDDDDDDDDGGGCFITTAVCVSLNKPDDCDELMTMRWLRDKLNVEDSDMAALIDEYYRVAPLVVKKIDSSQEAPTVYRQLWEKSISKIYNDIKQKDYQDAKLRYIRMLEDLCVRYDEPLSLNIKEIIKRVFAKKI